MIWMWHSILNDYALLPDYQLGTTECDVLLVEISVL